MSLTSFLKISVFSLSNKFTKILFSLISKKSVLTLSSLKEFLNTEAVDSKFVWIKSSVSTSIRKLTPPLKSKPNFIGFAFKAFSQFGVFAAKFSATTKFSFNSF